MQTIILTKLEEAQVMGVQVVANKLQCTEACDGWFNTTLNKADTLALAKELEYIANTFLIN